MSKPLVSIIIPTWNRPAAVKALLDSLLCMTPPTGGWEILLVNDGGLVPVSAHRELPLRILNVDHGGPAWARNRGAQAAKGEYLVFTDDDCRPAKDWLLELVAAAERLPDEMIGGYTANSLPDNVYSTASQLLIDFLYSYFNATQGRASMLTTNNMLVPAAQFHRMGGFDESFPHAAAEDRDFCDRWLQVGFAASLHPAAVVHHSHEMGFRGFVRQHFRYGQGAWLFHLKHAARSRQPVKLERVRFYRDLLCGPKRPIHSVLIFVTQVANAAGFFFEMLRRDRTTAGGTYTISVDGSPPIATDSARRAGAGSPAKKG